MNSLREKIKTVFLLMMENRSFDHMLGHLKIENPSLDVNGISPPLSQYDNVYKASPFSVYNFPQDVELDYDLPHEYTDVAIQMKKSKLNGKFTMKGFVEAFAASIQSDVNPECLPMGYFNSTQVPVTNFLAKNFSVCDNWFCPLPSSTQPNRTIAFSGDSSIFRTHLQPISIPRNIFSWMNKNQIKWKVYHDGFPFFALYPRLWPFVLSDHFRRYENLYPDLLHQPAEIRPNVIIIEPNYADAPRLGSKHPNDNHAPLAIGWGEDFLKRTYEAISANKEVWDSSVMVLYYDEHGGFYDHASPPSIPYNVCGKKHPFAFESLGPRIPAIVISPFTRPGSVSHDLYDHTSVLQLLAEIFTPGKIYSPNVALRRKAGIKSLSNTLNTEIQTEAPTLPHIQINVKTALGKPVDIAPATGMQLSFQKAALKLMKMKHEEVVQKFPELFQWKASITER